MQGVMGQDETDSDPSLDFTSPSFDALKALHTDPSKLQLPFPHVLPCDNLDTYESVVHGTKRRAPVTRETHTLHGNVGVVQLQPGGGASTQVKLREQKSREFQTVLEFMQKSDLGPLELLRLCHRDRAVVRVWIRHCVGVRGMCEGVPIAFDRHMNIVLCDVTEQYVPFKTFSNGGVVESRRKRKKRNKKEALKVEERQAVERPPSGVASSTAAVTCSHMTVTQDVVTRHLKQLFIRGDNIIMICRLPPPPTITDS